MPIILNGLKRLEYRGYDSVGIAISNGDLFVKKYVGRVDDFVKELKDLSIEGYLGIGHTRWATNGEVNLNNTHPHISNDGSIAVVHNGIIENYRELRNFLENKGFKFYSQTDSEVIPNLIQYFMDNNVNFDSAVIEAIKMLKGTYAILAIHKDHKKIIAARKESPLVLGVGNNEYFLASDIPSFIEHTKNVVYLKDNDFVFVDKNGFRIYNMNSGSVNRRIDSVNFDVEKAKKGIYEHYMLKEIMEQINSIEDSVRQDEEKIVEIANEIKRTNNVFIIGSGSSYHAALVGKYLFSNISKKHVNVIIASEFDNFLNLLDKNSLLIAVSQSGETYDVLNAVRKAKSKGVKIISIVNVMGSSLVNESDEYILMNVGPEIGVLSTKTYTAEIAILTLLAYAMANRYEYGKERLLMLRDEIYNLTSRTTRDKLKEIANKIKDKKDIFVIGRNLQYPTAMEAALKIKEVSYIHAEAYPSGELKHGTLSLIEEGVPCIIFSSLDTRNKILSNANEIKSRGGHIIGISDKNEDIFDDWIKVKDEGYENPIIQIIPIQILAYELAILRGNDPDHPRNLAKSVTVE